MAVSFVNLSFRSEVFYKECILKNFAKFTGKLSARVSFLVKRYSDTGVFL